MWPFRSKLELPDVTLVVIETREHALARLAAEDCLRQANFGGVLIYTDKPKAFDGLRINLREALHWVPDWEDKLGWSKCSWHDVPLSLHTSHMLLIQWDSWIVNPTLWSNEYLDYDYIGAPWYWLASRYQVGNGGFSLRSKRLLDYLLEHKDKYPVTTDADDALMCRDYRPSLEQAGFKWAPYAVAQRFAFEGLRPVKGTTYPFGFHGMFNWEFVLSARQFKRRARVACKSPGIMREDRWKNYRRDVPEMVAAFEDATGLRL